MGEPLSRGMARLPRRDRLRSRLPLLQRRRPRGTARRRPEPARRPAGTGHLPPLLRPGAAEPHVPGRAALCSSPVGLDLLPRHRRVPGAAGLAFTCGVAGAVGAGRHRQHRLQLALLRPQRTSKPPGRFRAAELHAPRARRRSAYEAHLARLLFRAAAHGARCFSVLACPAPSGTGSRDAPVSATTSGRCFRLFPPECWPISTRRIVRGP